MKGIFVLVIALLLALIAAALAPVFLADPGLVRIYFRGWTVEMSMLVLVLGVLFVWLVAYVLVRLWKLPGETARRMRDRHAMTQLEKGLLALTEGDWMRAERALEKSAGMPGKATARYLAAAKAADGQDAGERADYYLEQADEGGRRNHFLVELTRARLLADSAKYDGALEILEQMPSRRRRHPQVLDLFGRCYRKLGRWEALQEILPQMRKAGLVDSNRADDLRDEAAVAQIGQCARLDELQSAWQKLPKPMQRSAQLARAFAEQASMLGGSDLTESVLRASLKQQWESSLLLPYGDPAASDTVQRMKQCEKWLVEHPDDARLHLALGRLCARESLWGKARHHLVRSLELDPTVSGYDSLGQLLERKGELEPAMACFRNALRMNQGEPPLPLPATIARLNAPVS